LFALLNNLGIHNFKYAAISNAVHGGKLDNLAVSPNELNSQTTSPAKQIMYFLDIILSHVCCFVLG